MNKTVLFIIGKKHRRNNYTLVLHPAYKASRASNMA